eukprot:2795898-Rhodomonas_salina.4
MLVLTAGALVPGDRYCIGPGRSGPELLCGAATDLSANNHEVETAGGNGRHKLLHTPLGLHLRYRGFPAGSTTRNPIERTTFLIFTPPEIHCVVIGLQYEMSGTDYGYDATRSRLAGMSST